MGEILRGKYEIAFFTYDKFLEISAAAPYILNQLGLVVPDEAQFVTPPPEAASAPRAQLVP